MELLGGNSGAGMIGGGSSAAGWSNNSFGARRTGTT